MKNLDIKNLTLKTWALKTLSHLIVLCMTTSASLFAVADEFYVITGSFSSQESAQTEALQLQQHFQKSAVRKTTVAGQQRYRAVIGPFKDLNAAKEQHAKAEQLGYLGAWVTHVPVTPAIVEVTSSNLDSRPLRSLISQRDSVFVSTFKYQTPVLKNEIESLLSKYEGRQVQRSQLLQAKDRVNQLFVEHGYINTGAVIPDQEITEGEIQLDIVTGRINSLESKSDLRQHYLSSRLEISEPFNLTELQYRLKLLEQDPLIKRIDAKVAPGKNPGEATLVLNAETAPRFKIGLSAGNDRSPSIGSEYGRVDMTTQNVSGWGETLSLSSAITQGLDAHDALISMPLTSGGTRLTMKYSVSDSSVIEEPFDDIDVESQTESLGLTLDVPILKNLSRTLSLELILEARQNQTRLLGQNFSFSEGAIDGKSRVAPVRLAINYIRQSVDHSLAARLTISRGTSHFDATQNSNQADGQFTSYLAQFQYSKRLGDRLHLTTRALAQYATDPLLSVERYALGGVNTVRGYRQNQVVRDNAYLASTELHYRLDFPIFINLMGFVDWGKGENHDAAGATGSQSLSSVGVGFSLKEWRGFSAQVYIAHGFEDFSATQYDLQDDGIHFHMRYHREI